MSYTARTRSGVALNIVIALIATVLAVHFVDLPNVAAQPPPAA